MPELKIKQLQYEIDTWKRLLGFMTDENNHRKYRLSEILRNQFDNSLLEEIETFHNHFLKEDEQIASLLNDVNELEKLLVREIFEDGHIIMSFDNKLKKFRRNMRKAETQLAKLKADFNNYLSENIVQKR